MLDGRYLPPLVWDRPTILGNGKEMTERNLVVNVMAHGRKPQQYVCDRPSIYRSFFAAGRPAAKRIDAGRSPETTHQRGPAGCFDAARHANKGNAAGGPLRHRVNVMQRYDLTRAGPRQGVLERAVPRQSHWPLSLFNFLIYGNERK